MSNIAILIDDHTVNASLLVRLQRISKRGIGDIRDAIQQGQPVFEQELFDANYEEHASLIRSVIGCLEESSAPCRVYELPEGETMESCPSVDRYRIDIETLRNILHSADTELHRQMTDQE